MLCPAYLGPHLRAERDRGGGAGNSGGEATNSAAVVRGGAEGLALPHPEPPFGLSCGSGQPEDPLRLALAIGDFALDLAAGLFDGPVLSGYPCFRQVCGLPIYLL